MAVIFDGDEAEVAPPAETAVRSASIVQEHRASIAAATKEAMAHVEEKV
jgi:hypothetical protein